MCVGNADLNRLRNNNADDMLSAFLAKEVSPSYLPGCDEEILNLEKDFLEQLVQETIVDNKSTFVDMFWLRMKKLRESTVWLLQGSFHNAVQLKDAIETRPVEVRGLEWEQGILHIGPHMHKRFKAYMQPLQPPSTFP